MIRTAEFVSPKHPDKLCDIISDSILDEYLKQDPDSRVAIETLGGHGKVHLCGEITSKAKISNKSLKDLVFKLSGVNDVTINIVKQSPEISQGVDTGGAGDQGIMIGYACDENSDCVPQEYYLARKLNKFIYQEFPYDGKTQVTMNGNTLRVVVSFQNAPTKRLIHLTQKFFKKYPEYQIFALHCNPAGDWNQGGFEADAGLTGRKLAVDNYGPRVPLGGGAFSGKDCTKVDRSAAYMARRIAVDLLQKHKAKEVLVQLAYAIGYESPLQASAVIDGEHHIVKGYNLTPRGICQFLDLKSPIYSHTAMWGHMGSGFVWK